MERRAFLGTLLATLGALTIDPNQLLWQPATDGPVLVDGACVLMEDITRRLVFELSRFVAGPLVPANRRDELTTQLQIAMEPPPTLDRYGLDHERYIIPAAHAFAQRMKYYGVRRFAAPPIPIAYDGQAALIVSPEAGMAMRGIRIQHPKETGVWCEALRFDVLCGT